MARYYQKPQSPIVDLTPQYPAEFYSKLMEQAQQNLNQGTATGNAFMADAYGQEFIDQVARDKAMALAQDPIAKALDKDFVTNANIASAVGQASKAVAPWKNINKVHMAQAKREQELRDRLGANYIGNSVMNKSIMNPDGTYVNADDLKVIASNREDLQKALERDLADRKTKIRSTAIGMSPTADGKFIKYGSKTIRGITDKEWADEFANNSEMAKLYASQLPELAAAIKASGQSPEEFLQSEIGNITKQWVQGEVTDYNYMNNPSWSPGTGNFPTPRRLGTYDRGVKTIEGKEDKVSSIISTLYPETAQIAGPLRKFGNDFITDMKATVGISPAETFRSNTVEATKELNKLKSTYKDQYQKIKPEELSIYLGETFDASKLDERSYAPDRKNEAQEYRNKVQRAKDRAFLERTKLIESEGLSPLTSYSLKDADFDAGMDDVVLRGNFKGNTNVKNYETKDDVALSSLFEKGVSRNYMPRNDGNLDVVTNNGEVYSLDVFNADGVNTGVVDNETGAVLGIQRELYNALWEDDYNKFGVPITYGIPVPVPGYKEYGIPVYTVERSEQPGQPNTIRVTYYDPDDNTVHVDQNNTPISYPVDFNTITRTTAEALKLMNPNPSKQ